MRWFELHTHTHNNTQESLSRRLAHTNKRQQQPRASSLKRFWLCVYMRGGWDGWWCAVTAAGAERCSLYFYIYLFISFYYFLLFYFYFPSSDGWDPSEKGLLLSVFGVVTLGRLGLTPPTHLHLSSHDSASFRLTPPPIRLDNSALILFPYWMRRFPTHTHISCVSGPFLLPPQCGSHHLWIFFLVFTGNNNNSSWCASNNPAHWQNSDTNPMKFLFLFWNWTWKNIGHELIWNNDK